jgi:hypothetical protein
MKKDDLGYFNLWLREDILPTEEGGDITLKYGIDVAPFMRVGSMIIIPGKFMDDIRPHLYMVDSIDDINSCTVKATNAKSKIHYTIPTGTKIMIQKDWVGSARENKSLKRKINTKALLKYLKNKKRSAIKKGVLASYHVVDVPFSIREDSWTLSTPIDFDTETPLVSDEIIKKFNIKMVVRFEGGTWLLR